MNSKWFSCQAGLKASGRAYLLIKSMIGQASGTYHLTSRSSLVKEEVEEGPRLLPLFLMRGRDTAVKKTRQSLECG